MERGQRHTTTGLTTPFNETRQATHMGGSLRPLSAYHPRTLSWLTHMCSRLLSTTSGTGYGSNRPWAYRSVPYRTQQRRGTTMQCGSVVLHYILQDTMDSVTSRNRASTYETMSRQALCSPLFCLTDKPNKWLDRRMESQHLRYGIAAHYRQEACAARLRRIRE